MAETQKVSYTATASLKITGITPEAGPKPTIADSFTLSLSNVTSDDRVVTTFIINAGTTATLLNLGKITAGKALWLEVSGPVECIITQDTGGGATDREIGVNKFLLLDSDFSAIKLANVSATAQQVSVAVIGTRDAVGVGSGIF